MNLNEFCGFPAALGGRSSWSSHLLLLMRGRACHVPAQVGASGRHSRLSLCRWTLTGRATLTLTLHGVERQASWRSPFAMSLHLPTSLGETMSLTRFRFFGWSRSSSPPVATTVVAVLFRHGPVLTTWRPICRPGSDQKPGAGYASSRQARGRVQDGHGFLYKRAYSLV